MKTISLHSDDDLPFTGPIFLASDYTCGGNECLIFEGHSDHNLQHETILDERLIDVLIPLALEGANVIKVSIKEDNRYFYYIGFKDDAQMVHFKLKYL